MTRDEKIERISLLEERRHRIVTDQIDCSKLTRKQTNAVYDEVLADDNIQAQRKLCRTDLFFLLSIACGRADIDRDWLYERCREVQAEPDGYLDLWAREHYKSSIITFGKSLQDILADPEVTIGIFSHTRPIAKGFLGQLKRELEQNRDLIELFPDVLYSNPKVEAPKWSLDDGIIVRRKENPTVATVEAWGLVDGQPTGKHFKVMVYDDIVTLASVTTPEQIHKTTDAWATSLNLGVHGGRRRMIGTRYHVNDSYREILKRGAAVKRLHAATDDGTMQGKPVLLDRPTLIQKRSDQGPYVFGCQMLLNPTADSAQSFKEKWVQHYKTLGNHAEWNRYLLVDPANAKKKSSDSTVMVVIGLAPDQNYYLLYAIRDRLNLSERTEKVFQLHRDWNPLKVGYEQYGMQADIQHIRHVQEEKNYRFKIQELGGAMPKQDRIKRLVPLFEQSKFWLPESLEYKDCEDRTRDFVKEFLEDEYLAFPVCVHDDMLDVMARILDIGSEFPKKEVSRSPIIVGTREGTWMGS